MSHSNPHHKQSQDPNALDCSPLEASAPLESSTPLEFSDRVQRVVQTTNVEQPTRNLADSSVPPFPVNQVPVNQGREAVSQRNDSPQPKRPMENPQVQDPINQEPIVYRQEQAVPTPKIAENIDIQLLEERLIVDRKKRKVGEVIIRKEIETRIVEVPVRREKLIVEQVGAETRQLASIDLEQPELDSVVSANTAGLSLQPTISSEFTSIKAASQFLGTIAASQPDLGCQTVQIRIVVDDAEQAQIYQQWLDRYTVNHEQMT